MHLRQKDADNPLYHHHHHHHYFENVNFFQAHLGLVVCLEMKPLHISMNTSHQAANQADSCYHLHTFYKSFCLCPTFHPSHLHNFYRQTPNPPLSYAPDAQTISFYHASPPQPPCEYPTDCTKPHNASYPSKTLHTSTSPSYALSRLCQFSTFIAHVSVPYVSR